MKKLIALLLAACLMLGLMTTAFAADEKSNDIVILYTNDVHCAVDDNIGYAGLAAYKKEMQAAYNYVALVDCGDSVQGDVIGTLSKGEYLVDIMNEVGYDFASFGNHEFDYTLPQLQKLIDKAKYQYLCCNLTYTAKDGKGLTGYKAYEIKTYGDIKVAFVGIDTPESFTKSTPTYFQDANGNFVYSFAEGNKGADLYNKVQKYSFANIDKFQTGSLVTRLTNDVTQMQNMVNMLLRMCLRAPGMMIGAIIMAVIMNARLALILAVIMPFMIIVLFFLIKYAFPKFGIMQTKLDALNTNVQESITNIRVVKSFVREDHQRKTFAKANKDLKDTGISAMNVMIIMMPLMMLFMNLASLAVVWFGGQEVMDTVINATGGMDVGDLSAFLTYITQILSSLMMLSMLFVFSSRALASSKRVREVLDEVPDIRCRQKGHKRRHRIQECRIPLLQDKRRPRSRPHQLQSQGRSDGRYHRFDRLRQNNARFHDSPPLRCR